MIPTLRLVDRDGAMSMSAFTASGTRQARDLAPGWTREPAVLLARQIVQEGLLAPSLRVAGDFQAYGRERVRRLDLPVIIAANHSSHVDVIAIREACRGPGAMTWSRLPRPTTSSSAAPGG